MKFILQKTNEGYIIVLCKNTFVHPEEEFVNKLGFTHEEYLQEAFKYNAYQRECSTQQVKSQKAYWILKNAAYAFIEDYLNPKLLMFKLVNWDKINLPWHQL